MWDCPLYVLFHYNSNHSALSRSANIKAYAQYVNTGLTVESPGSPLNLNNICETSPRPKNKTWKEMFSSCICQLCNICITYLCSQHVVLRSANEKHCCGRTVHVLVSDDRSEAVNSISSEHNDSFHNSESGCFFDIDFWVKTFFNSFLYRDHSWTRKSVCLYLLVI